MADLEEVPLTERRYRCLANYVRANNDRERLLIEEIGLVHPMLETQMPQRDGIAEAFDYVAERQPLDIKYGDAIDDVRRLYSELGPQLAG